MESFGNGGRIVNMSSIGGFGGCTANNSGSLKNAFNGKTHFTTTELNGKFVKLHMAQQNMQSMV